MIVADGALPGEPHPGVERRGRAVDGVAEEKLLVDRAPLARRHVAAREAGSCLLLARGAGEEIAGELENRELIEGEVFVEGLHDPVAVGPHVALVVEVEAVGVGIARDVEPMAGHLLAMVRARQQPIDELVIGIRGGIGDEGRHLFRSRRQAGEREGDAADERRPVGRGVEGQPLGRHAGLEESIDRVAGVARCGRHLGADDLPERPVLLVGGPGRDPARQQVLLGLRKLFVEVGRGHDRVGIGGDDPRDQGA